MKPLLENRRLSRFFLLGVAGLLVISVLLPVVGLVPLKMLPFDNKNDFLVVADLPNDSPLEVTQDGPEGFWALPHLGLGGGQRGHLRRSGRPH